MTSKNPSNHGTRKRASTGKGRMRSRTGQFDGPEHEARSLLEAAKLDDKGHAQLGGPTTATLGDLLDQYARQFTVLKHGWLAELTRVNHYLVGAGLPALEGVVENGVRRLRTKATATGATTPSGWRAHRDSCLAKRATTYALIEALGRMKCSDLTTKMLRALHTTMLAEGLSESTAQKELALLKAALNVAIREWGWKDYANPVVGIRLGRSKTRFVRLTQEQEQRLVDALAESDNPQFWPLVELAWTTTMRRGSLLKLEWRNVDLEQRQVRVWAKGYDVELPLSQRAVDLLCLVPRNESGRVFTMSANAVKLAWQRARVRAGLPALRFADLRHLGATFYARAGLNAHQLRLVLGHRTTHMAEVYVNLVASDVVEALDRVDVVRPVTRQMPPRDVHAGPARRSVMAERRTARLNGPPKLPANVVPLRRRMDDSGPETP